MSKCVLVMDMPSSCVKCGLYEYAISRCNATDKFQNDISEDFKPEWCPLKPMPEKVETFNCEELCDVDDWYDSGYNNGYNACIDELLKGEEG